MAHDKNHTMDWTGLALKVDAVIDTNGREVAVSDIAASKSVTALTDNTGGTASGTLASITAGTSYAQADIVAIKNALASINAKLSALIGA